MVSYFKIFKSSDVAMMPNVKVITSDRTFPPPPSVHNEELDQASERVEKDDPIVSAAKAEAEEILSQARASAAALEEEMSKKHAAWMAEQQTKLEGLMEEANTRGYLAGYEAGMKAAEEKVLQDYAGMIDEAARIVQQVFIEHP